MSTRELAVSLIDSLSEAQAAAVVDFIAALSGVREEKKDDEVLGKRRAFDRIKELRNAVDEGTGNNRRDYKEMYLEYLDERYGS
ncbi:MAG: hypothetical protein NC078_00550 [Ruminococcus sp.]|nr:hypothetical protein [Ruminococcus sp.]